MKMKEKLNEFFKGKSVAILGFGREGRSTLDILRETECGKIGILDKNPVDKKDCDGCTLHCGENYLDFMDDYDIIMKAPGIALFDKVPPEIKEKITSQTDLFLRFCDNHTIGVTGTKGKSTTSSLIEHMLKSCGKKAILIGNIGIPPLSVIDALEKGMVVVLEMSCHQLEYVKASPNTAVLLNIYEEHLDHYKNFNAYKYAKENIYRYQSEYDTLIYNIDLRNDEITHIDEISPRPSRTVPISMEEDENADVYLSGDDIVFFNEKITYNQLSPKLEGKHNLYNIAAALTAVSYAGVGCNYIKAADSVGQFNGLEHRMETVRTVNGVRYINDSISTVPLATIWAVKTFNADTVIIGGMDRGIMYDDLIKFLNEGYVKTIICLPDSGHKIADMLNTTSNVFKVNNMEDAVKKASEKAKHCCVLSPAAASYGFYKNFEERGKHFKELVNAL